MFRACQNCHRSMSPHQGGWICTSCGHIETGDTTNGSTIDSAASNLGFDPIPTPVNTISHDQSATFKAEAIVNHRASSYYQQHLHERLSQLTTPELPAPDETLPLAAHFADAEANRAPSSELVITPQSPLESLPPDTEQAQSSAPEIRSPHENQIKTPRPERPFRPSAYVVHATTPLTHHDKPERPLPSALNHIPKSEAELLSQAHQVSETIHLAPSPSPHALADELLAAAAKPHPPKSQSHYTWVLMAGSALVLIAGAIGAWLLLKQPNTPSNSPQVTPSIQNSNPLLTTTKEPTKRDAQRKSDLNSIAIGLEAYHKSTGAYPVGNDISILASLEKTTPPFITHINLDPSSTTGSDIKYSYSSDGSGFTLSAILENPLDADAKDGLYIVRNK